MENSGTSNEGERESLREREWGRRGREKEGKSERGGRGKAEKKKGMETDECEEKRGK